MENNKILTPLTDERIKELEVGQMVYITGKIYTGRDAAHKRMVEMIKNGEEPPFDFNGQIIYYAGPAPNKPGQAIGSVGPTTSYRMDSYSPFLIEQGLKGMIGKGVRGQAVKDAMIEHTGVYFAAIGGAAALMSKAVKTAKVIAFEDLGPEAIRELEVENLPVIVAIDSKGNDIYEQNK